MLLEDLKEGAFPYFKHQKLFVLPPDGQEGINFYPPSGEGLISAVSSNGIGLHCMVLDIDSTRERVRVRFFGDVNRVFSVNGTETKLSSIEGVDNLSSYSSRDFFNKFGRARLDLENGLVGWLSFDNTFMVLESEEYSRYMSGISSSEALRWEDSGLGISLDAYTSSREGDDVAKTISDRMGRGTSIGKSYLKKVLGLTNKKGRKGKYRGRLSADYERSKRGKRTRGEQLADTKIDRAVSIYRSSKRLTRAEVVSKIAKQLGVSESTASTYFSKAKNIVEGGGTQAAWEKSGY